SVFVFRKFCLSPTIQMALPSEPAPPVTEPSILTVTTPDPCEPALCAKMAVEPSPKVSMVPDCFTVTLPAACVACPPLLPAKLAAQSPPNPPLPLMDCAMMPNVASPVVEIKPFAVTFTSWPLPALASPPLEPAQAAGSNCKGLETSPAMPPPPP